VIVPLRGRSALSGLSWASAYLAVSRLSTVAAVPLILTQLGERVYTAWVLAGTVVMAQGLMDVGMTAATVRYVALAKVDGARGTVISVFRRSLAFYFVLSMLVGALLVGFRDALVDAVPAFGEPAIAHDARRLVIYAAIAFGMTNFVTVVSAALQGLDRVAEAFRAQTIGWLVYVPVLWVLLERGAGVDALGLAWVAAFALQGVLVAIALPKAIRATATTGSVRVSNRELLSLGGRWQASSWADFASLQLPRIVAGLTLPGAAVVSLDLAMRGAQIVVAPFFALLPLVLPAASREWGAKGRPGLANVASGWHQAFSRALTLTAAACLPLLIPAIAVWSDRSLDSLDIALIACILLGTVAHTWTGVMTSALLAAGDVGPIVRYKLQQLVLAAVLLPVGGAIGLDALALAVAVVMTLPAVDFMRRAQGRLGVVAGGRDSRARLAAASAMVCVPGLILVVAAPRDVSAWVLLAIVSAGVLAGSTIAVPLSGLRPAVRRLRLRADKAPV
jgi:hypothetical protein